MVPRTERRWSTHRSTSAIKHFKANAVGIVAVRADMLELRCYGAVAIICISEDILLDF